MSLTFPTVALFNQYAMRTNKFALTPRQSLSRTSAGDLIAVDFGRQVWMAEFTSLPQTHENCVEIEAYLNSLGGATELILVRDTRRENPVTYPDGVFNDTGVIASLGGDGKSLSLSGLDANFMLKRGDYFHYLFNSRRYLHQVVEAITASGAGVTGPFEITPHYIAGVTVSTAVVFKKPNMQLRLTPGSVSFSDTGRLIGTVSFAGVQRL